MPPPSFRSCQFCGQQFGSTSLPIHERRCRSRPVNATQVASLVSPCTPERSKAPKALCNGSDGASATPDWSTEAPDEVPVLQGCRHCTRTFFPERLAAHERVCCHRSERVRRTHKLQSSKVRTLRPPRRALRPPSRWRQQHEAFLAVVRANRPHGPDIPTYAHTQQCVERLSSSLIASNSPGNSPFNKRSSGRHDSPTRRPTPAQRHAMEWRVREEQQQLLYREHQQWQPKSPCVQSRMHPPTWCEQAPPAAQPRAQAQMSRPTGLLNSPSRPGNSLATVGTPPRLRCESWGAFVHQSASVSMPSSPMSRAATSPYPSSCDRRAGIPTTSMTMLQLLRSPNHRRHGAPAALNFPTMPSRGPQACYKTSVHG